MLKLLLPLMLSAAPHCGAQAPAPAAPQPLISHADDKTARKPEMLRAGDQIKPVKDLSVENGTAAAAAFSPYGDALVTAGNYGLRIWATANWTQFKTVPPQQTAFTAICFAPAGDQIAAGAEDGGITVWKLPDFTVQKSLADHKGAVLSCAFSPDGKFLATAGTDNVVYIYQEPDLAPVKSLIGKDEPFLFLLFSQDSARLFAGGQGKAALWQTASWQKEKDFASHPESPDNRHYGSFSSDGTFLAVFAGKEISVWRLDSPDSPYLSIPLAEAARAGVFSRDGRSILAGDASGNLRVWTMPSGELARVLGDAHVGPVRETALSPDGKTLFTLDGGGDIKIWDAMQLMTVSAGKTGGTESAAPFPRPAAQGKVAPAPLAPGKSLLFLRRYAAQIAGGICALALIAVIAFRRKKADVAPQQQPQPEPAALSPMAMQAFAKQTSPHLEIHTLETSMHQSGSINAVKVPTERYPIPEDAEDNYPLEHGLTLPAQGETEATAAEAPLQETLPQETRTEPQAGDTPEQEAPMAPPEQQPQTQNGAESAPKEGEQTAEQPVPAPPPPPTASAPKAKDESGRLIAGRFKLLREIGEGATGKVFEVRDITAPSAPRYALKRFVDEIAPGIPDWEDFTLLAKKLSKLRHPGIAGVESLETENGVWLVTELAPGMDLSKHLKMYGKMSPFEAGGFAMHAARAIAYAHENGFIHSDLKPSNIIVDTSGRAMVTDLGLALEAKLLLKSQTGKENSQDSEPYYSPQAYDQVFDKSGDIYSLGVILYEMIAGEPPFRGPGYLAQKIALTPKPLKEYAPAIPAAMEAAIMRCMAPLPDKRFPSAAELADVLQLAAKP